MGIRPIYYATQFGAIDSDAAEDGGPYSAHLLRTIGRNSNHLLRKGHMLLNMVWPMAGDRNLDGDGETFGQRVGARVRSHWTRFVHPVSISKKPGLTEASVRITASIGGTDKVYFRVCTRATGEASSPDNANIVEATGDGTETAQTFSIASVPMDPGPEEVVSLWARGSSLTTPPLGVEATYGYPNTGTFGTDRQLFPDHMWESGDAHSSSNPIWNHGSSNAYDSVDHDVYFYNRQGAMVTYPRRILAITPGFLLSAVSGDVRLDFDGYPLDEYELDAVRDGGKFELRQSVGGGGFELFGVAVAANGRSV